MPEQPDEYAKSTMSRAGRMWPEKRDTSRRAKPPLRKGIGGAKPFTWTADPDRILAAVKRGKEVLKSIH